MSKKLKLTTGQSYKSSVRFCLNPDGSMEQVIKIFNPKDEPTSVKVMTTAHGRLNLTKHGLSATITFDREKTSFDDMVQQFYAETDDMAAYITSHQPEIRQLAAESFTSQKPNVTIEQL